jgi:hypothetical protein
VFVLIFCSQVLPIFSLSVVSADSFSAMRQECFSFSLQIFIIQNHMKCWLPLQHLFCVHRSTRFEFDRADWLGYDITCLACVWQMTYSNSGQIITTLFDGEEYGLLCCNAVYLGRSPSTFRRNASPPSAESESKARKKPATGSANRIYFTLLLDTIPQTIKCNLKWLQSMNENGQKIMVFWTWHPF